MIVIDDNIVTYQYNQPKRGKRVINLKGGEQFITRFPTPA
jgi:hypothetical protein